MAEKACLSFSKHMFLANPAANQTTSRVGNKIKIGAGADRQPNASSDIQTKWSGHLARIHVTDSNSKPLLHFMLHRNAWLG